MEPLDWQKQGFEPADQTARKNREARHKARQEAQRQEQQEARRLQEAHSARITREERFEEVYGRNVASAPESAEEAAEDFGSGVPGDYSGLTPEDLVAREAVEGWGTEQLALATANILTAPERGLDMVTLPAHYARYTIEPIRFICENKLDFFQGNVVKYIVRHDAKNGIEDIDKVIRYAQMYKRFLMRDPDWWKAGKPEDLNPQLTSEGPRQ